MKRILKVMIRPRELHGATDEYYRASLVYGDLIGGDKMILKNKYGKTGRVSAEEFENIKKQHKPSEPAKS